MRLGWRYISGIVLGFALGLAPAFTTAYAPPIASAPATRPALKAVPESLADLRALQARVESVVAKVSPCVVGLRVKGGQGSGVIISDDGFVLTAGHVATDPGLDVTVVLSNGKTVKGKTLGINRNVDSGLMKIVGPPPGGGKWPYVELGHSGELQRGEWCVALGHPGGYKIGRSPPLRLGRVLDVGGRFIRTDCTLVGGDSGGPLFDLDGNVIGIHSRIGQTTNDNMHVPIDTYRDTWTRLAAGEAWGDIPGGRRPWLGLDTDRDARNCKITQIEPHSPAEKAGLKVGDEITSFDGDPIASYSALASRLISKKPGDQVTFEIKRDDQTLTVRLTIGRRPSGNP